MILIIILTILSLLFFAVFIFSLFVTRIRLYVKITCGILFGITSFSLASVLICLFSSYGNRVDAAIPQVIEIKRGLSLYGIGEVLKQGGVIDSIDKLIWAAKLLGMETGLKAGKYEIPAKRSYSDILHILYSGEGIQEKVTFPEGIQTKEIVSLLEERIGTDRERFLGLVNDKDFIQSLGLDVPSLDGFLLPETYTFYWGMNEEEIITVYINEFKKILTDSVVTAINESKYSLREYVILASIIEGEAIYNEERSLISAVYHNRLEKKIRLQADPTIQYIIEDGPRRLLKDDLQIDSPYNTYRYYGLPPGPICNPGRSSILAAIFPAGEDYLYFVARGDGYHTFSKSNQEHIQAKKTLDRLRRELKRKQNN